jgi:glycine/D-amino acid oxidase-like deaminating enzyme/Rieske Fe-S protein
MQLPSESCSLWIATEPGPRYGPLGDDLAVDDVVVGGGITGLAAAWLLAEAGRSVVVVEKDRIAAGETGHTTAHLTEEVDRRYTTITRNFGHDAARLVAASSRDAIDWIESTAQTCGIECSFERLPGFLYTERAAGLTVTFTTDIPLPFPVAGGLRIEYQAQFNPRAFLLGLARRFETLGGRIFEGTRVVAVHDGEPCRVETDQGAIVARTVLMATNVPLNWAALITKLPAYRTYAIGVRLQGETPQGLFWDTDAPYHYTRTHRTANGDVVIIGGEDHKTGAEPETVDRYDALADYACRHFSVSRIDYRWSGQILEPVDGLPYIGLNAASRHVYVSSGYSGNGMTWGIVAARVVSDLVIGRQNPYAELYKATRITPLASVRDFVTENLDFPTHFIRDRLTNADVDGSAITDVPLGSGRILAIDGRKYAVFRDEYGDIHSLSPVCPHMRCDVEWNEAERSWDCPCHGSRFDATGHVLNGPAVTPLQPLEFPVSVNRGHRDDG